MSEVMTVPQQTEWLPTYNACGYTIRGLSDLSDIDEGSIRKYLFEGRAPRKKNLEKMEKAMFEAAKKPRIEYHPSYGYATKEQIEKLQTVGKGAEHDQILKDIERQTANKGKYI